MEDVGIRAMNRLIPTERLKSDTLSELEVAQGCVGSF